MARARTCIPRPVRRPESPGGTTWPRGHGANPSAPASFLTAVGPGRPAFATFQPYNENVFSIHDDLTGVADQDTISYLVVGWQSDPDADILVGGRPIDSILARLGWQIIREGKHPVAGSVYCGRVLGLVWDRTGSAPESARPAPGDIRLTIGHS